MQKKSFYRPTYPIFFRAVTGNKQFIFLGLIDYYITIKDLASRVSDHLGIISLHKPLKITRQDIQILWDFILININNNFKEFLFCSP